MTYTESMEHHRIAWAKAQASAEGPYHIIPLNHPVWQHGLVSIAGRRAPHPQQMPLLFGTRTK